MIHAIVLVLGPFIIRFFSKYLTRTKQLAISGIVSALLLIASKTLFDLFPGVSIAIVLVPWIILIAICNCVQSSMIATIATDSSAAQRIGVGEALGVYRILERSGTILAPLLCGYAVATLSQTNASSFRFLYAMGMIGVILLEGTLVFIIFQLLRMKTKSP